MSSLQFSQVSINALATVSEDGKHLQRVLMFADGHQKVLGCLIGDKAGHRFELSADTKSAERIEITQGECEIIMAGDEQPQYYREGQSFVVASGSQFSLVTQGLVQYIRHFEG